MARYIHRVLVRPHRLAGIVALCAAQTLLLGRIEAQSGAPSPGECDEAAPIVDPLPTTRPWLDPALAPDARADLLLAQMTLAEKVDMVTGDPCGKYGLFNRAIPRVDIPALTMAYGPAGVRINNIATNEGKATALPAPIALAATWDDSLAHLYGDVLGKEAFATGHNVLLGPAIDIARTPLAGRAFEAFGEEPLLHVTFAPRIVTAIQRSPVLANAKHFLAYTQETDRQIVDVAVDERTLHEIYLPAFQALVEANVRSATCSFNGVNGTPMCGNPLMNDLLKGQMGFRDFIMSDYGATPNTVEAKIAGLDQEQPGKGRFGDALLAAVQNGQVPLATVDDSVRRILLAMFENDLFDAPVQITPLAIERHAATARAIAADAIVLFKNTNNVLPLGTVGSIAVIGADAANVSAQGGGSSEVQLPLHSVSPLQGVIDRAGPAVTVKHAEGTDPVTGAHLMPGPAFVPSSVLAPAGGQPGTRGLLGQYWTTTDFSGTPAVERVDRQVALVTGFINFPGFSASSQPSLPPEFSLADFSARWTGTITPNVTGDYTLTLTSLGRGAVYLDDALLIDQGELHDVSSKSATVSLVAGVPRNIRVDYVANRASSATASYSNVGGQVALQWEPPAGTIVPAVQEAIDLARASDVAIMFVRDYETEDVDRLTLTLPNAQDQLIEQVAAANPNTIVVLMTGQPVTMPWLDRVPAVLEAWYPGQEQGTAMADVLFGDVNPSGKLPVTFPVGIEQTPTSTPDRFPGVGGVVTFGEEIFVGYRWYDENGLTPLFPFGFGLSYTTFGYSDLLVEDLWAVTNGQRQGLRTSFTVTNTGSRAGAEVAQVYTGPLPVQARTPPQRLVGFSKVELAPGASQRITIDVGKRLLAYWDVAAGGWVEARGVVPVRVGGSSRDIKLTGSGTPTVRADDP